MNHIRRNDVRPLEVLVRMKPNTVAGAAFGSILGGVLGAVLFGPRGAFLGGAIGGGLGSYHGAKADERNKKQR